MATPPPVEEIAHDDLCPICHVLLYDPVRTRCNHILCASCMVQWADASSTNIVPSSLDLDLSTFNPAYDPVADLAQVEANCPMCRTSTTATRHAELNKELEERYPRTFAERRTEEEEAKGQQIGQDGMEGMMILIGNKHRLDRSRGEETYNTHDWTFFVRCSRPDIIREVRINLHPTFRPRQLTLREPPFEVRRLGWGFFRIEAEIVLKEPYRFIEGVDSRRRILELDWMLSFEGRGKQGRVRVKVKSMEGASPEEPSRLEHHHPSLNSPSPVRWPHMDDEEDENEDTDEDDEDYDDDED